jgi:hypothetical protein
MGQGSHVEDGDWDAMAFEWIRIGAVSPEVHESLQRRFMRCRAKKPPPSPERPAFRIDDGADDRRGPKTGAGPMRRDVKGSRFAAGRR